MTTTDHTTRLTRLAADGDDDAARRLARLRARRGQAHDRCMEVDSGARCPGVSPEGLRGRPAGRAGWSSEATRAAWMRLRLAVMCGCGRSPDRFGEPLDSALATYVEHARFDDLLSSVAARGSDRMTAPLMRREVFHPPQPEEVCS